MANIGLIGILLFFLFGLVLVAVIAAPWVERLLTDNRDAANAVADAHRVRAILRAWRKLAPPSHVPDMYRDSQLDELIQDQRLDEAARLTAERLWLAYEQGLEERVALYREYERSITAQQRQA